MRFFHYTLVWYISTGGSWHQFGFNQHSLLWDGMDRQMDEQMNRWLNGWIDGWTGWDGMGQDKIRVLYLVTHTCWCVLEYSLILFLTIVTVEKNLKAPAFSPMETPALMILQCNKFSAVEWGAGIPPLRQPICIGCHGHPSLVQDVTISPLPLESTPP